MPGPPDSTSESLGDASGRDSLQCESNPRAAAPGSHILVEHGGVPGRLEVCKDGRQGESRSSPPLREPDSWTKTGGLEQQRIREERRRKEQGRKERQAEGRWEETGSEGSKREPVMRRDEMVDEKDERRREPGLVGLAPNQAYEVEDGEKFHRAGGQLSAWVQKGGDRVRESLHDWQHSPPEDLPKLLSAVSPAAATNAGSVSQPPAVDGHDEGTTTSLPDLAGTSLKDMGQHLFLALQTLSWNRPGKTLTTASSFLLPLPLDGYDFVPEHLMSWQKVLLAAINSLYGSSAPLQLSPTAGQKRLVQGLLPFLERFGRFTEKIPKTDFETVFQTRGINYRGEEIKLAQSFSWLSIKSALPQEVGTLRLEDFVTGGCAYFVANFTEYLLPEGMQELGRTPQVRVSDEDWPEVCRGLLETRVCEILPISSLHHVGDRPLLNGMFSVSKNEVVQGIELQRLIMNMIPLNRLNRSLRGDVGTLPTLAGFNALFLEEGEVAIMCSEDVKCFYYLFQVPSEWKRFMGFAKLVPPDLVPRCWEGKPCVLVASVLPMGYVNSVGLAQHMHRNVVRWSMTQANNEHAEQELRRDKPSTLSSTCFRVYLDNWDQVKKVDAALVEEIEGKPSAEQLALRHQYEILELPRHPKKAVEGNLQAEIQGALLDGREGVAYAKPSKLVKYVGLAWELVSRGYASQRELQVVAGGLVYITMFRRALLCMEPHWKLEMRPPSDPKGHPSWGENGAHPLYSPVTVGSVGLPHAHGEPGDV